MLAVQAARDPSLKFRQQRSLLLLSHVAARVGSLGPASRDPQGLVRAEAGALLVENCPADGRHARPSQQRAHREEAKLEAAERVVSKLDRRLPAAGRHDALEAVFLGVVKHVVLDDDGPADGEPERVLFRLGERVVGHNQLAGLHLEGPLGGQVERAVDNVHPGRRAADEPVADQPEVGADDLNVGHPLLLRGKQLALDDAEREVDVPEADRVEPGRLPEGAPLQHRDVDPHHVQHVDARPEGAGLRWVLKDYFCRHSDLCRRENQFCGLTSAWKPVFMPAWVGMPTEILFKNPFLGQERPDVANGHLPSAAVGKGDGF